MDVNIFPFFAEILFFLFAAEMEFFPNTSSEAEILAFSAEVWRRARNSERGWR
jgi:hypothetical protein